LCWLVIWCILHIQPLKKSKPDSISEVTQVAITENGQAADDDVITDDDDEIATLSHGTITRALYGDEEGKVLS